MISCTQVSSFLNFFGIYPVDLTISNGSPPYTVVAISDGRTVSKTFNSLGTHSITTYANNNYAVVAWDIAIPNLESFDNSRVGRVSVQELLKLNFSAIALTTPAFPLFPLRELSKRKPKLGIAAWDTNKLVGDCSEGPESPPNFNIACSPSGTDGIKIDISGESAPFEIIVISGPSDVEDQTVHQAGEVIINGLSPGEYQILVFNSLALFPGIIVEGLLFLWWRIWNIILEKDSFWILVLPILQ